MTIKFEVPGKERKRLVQTLAAWLGSDVKYNGAPSFSYEVERFTVGRDGDLTFDGKADDEVIERLLEHLYDEGFRYELPAAEAEEKLHSAFLPRNGLRRVSEGKHGSRSRMG